MSHAGQRAVGALQIVGGIADMVYGAGYGGIGGGTYLIGSGIQNVSGSKKGTGRQGTKGFLKDLALSSAAQGAAYGGGYMTSGFGAGGTTGGMGAGTQGGLGSLSGLLGGGTSSAAAPAATGELLPGGGGVAVPASYPGASAGYTPPIGTGAQGSTASTFSDVLNKAQQGMKLAQSVQSMTGGTPAEPSAVNQPLPPAPSMAQPPPPPQGTIIPKHEPLQAAGTKVPFTKAGGSAATDPTIALILQAMTGQTAVA